MRRLKHIKLDSEQHTIQIQHIVDSSSTIMVLRHLLHTHQNHELDLEKLFYSLANLPVGSYRAFDLHWLMLRLTLQMLRELLMLEGYSWRLIEYATHLTKRFFTQLKKFDSLMAIHIFFNILRFYLWVVYDADGFSITDQNLAA